MADWFTIIICLLIGFGIGRIYPLIKKFMKFIDKEKQEKSV
jgi:F0F1-type ATP synthase assembly protein I